MDTKKLAVCALFENATTYLPEWLAYHSVAGVDHFVLYDNGSTDDPARVIRNSPLADKVTLIRWPQRPGQLAAYRHFIDIFAPGFEWAAFLGVDDFLLPLAGRSVRPMLDRLGVAAAVLVQRRVFQPVPQGEPPHRLLIETHLRRAADEFPANRHIRVIARCSELLDVTTTPYEFRVNGLVFNAAGQLTPNTAIQGPPCYQNLVVNHYCTGPAEAWLARIREDSAAAAATLPDAGDGLADLARVPDTTIAAFAPAVRQLLGLAAVQPVPPQSSATPAAAPPPEPAATTQPTPPQTRAPSAPVAAGAPPPPTAATEPAAPAPAAPATVAPVPPAPPPPAPSLPAPPPSAPRPSAMPPPATPAAPAAPRASIPAPPSSPAAAQVPPPPSAAAPPADVEQAWLSRGVDALERGDGLGLVFRDRSRTGEHWLAALRGPAATAIDPAFLVDEFERIRDFPTAAAARAACDATLATLSPAG